MTVAHKRKKQPEAVRQGLIDAAIELASQQGIGAVTLDRVAARAGVSKGALQHHFDSKGTLMDAILARIQHEFGRNIADLAARDGHSKGRAARAYVDMSATPLSTSERDRWWVMAQMLMVDARFREPWAEWETTAAADDFLPGEDPVGLLICRLAVDGLWLSDLMGHRVIDPDMRLAIVDRLASMTGRDQ
jgi:AcrR family transcriptional regulator